MVIGAYVAIERTGPTTHAGLVEYTQNLTGGFLAMGISEDQPGFITLAALDQDHVDIRAAQTSNSFTGTQVVLVSEDGAVETYAVGGAVDQFNTLGEGADCSQETAVKRHRCGAPFTDLQEAWATWPGERVPDRVRGFLEPFRDRRMHKRKDD